jgi:hypothetical protein
MTAKSIYLERQKTGLYKLEIRDESGRIILSESNIYCDRALAIIKEANSNDD